MNKIAVVYRSKYGATKQYAEWIASALDADIFNATDVVISRLKGYDLIIYGGGIYAGYISNISLVSKFPPKPLIIFTVGLADPAEVNFIPTLEKSLSPAKIKSSKFFHFRGALDIDKLGFFHGRIIKMLKKALQKKDASQLRSEEVAILQSLGQKVDFASQDAIAPIIEYVKQLEGGEHHG